MILNYENGTRSRRLYYVVELRLMRRRGDKTNVKHDVIVHLFLKVLGRSKQTAELTVCGSGCAARRAMRVFPKSGSGREKFTNSTHVFPCLDPFSETPSSTMS